MGEIIVTVLKFVARFVFVFAAVVAFITLLTVSTSFVFASINQGAFGDVFAIVSMWTPFNLTVLMAWAVTASTAYIGYRLSLTAMIWANRFLQS